MRRQVLRKGRLQLLRVLLGEDVEVMAERLFRLADNGAWPWGLDRTNWQRTSQDVHIMAGQRPRPEPEASPFLNERFERLHLFYRPVRLPFVVVHDHREVGELVFPGTEGGFPDRAFVALPVSEDHVDTLRAVCQSETNPER